MFEEIKSIFADDYIYIKRKKIRPFSLMWWVIRTGQTILCILFVYLLYCCAWIMAAFQSPLPHWLIQTFDV